MSSIGMEGKERSIQPCRLILELKNIFLLDNLVFLLGSTLCTLLCLFNLNCAFCA